MKCFGWLALVIAGGLLLSRAISQSQSERPQFASDRPEPIKPAPFDADRAMEYLKALCKIGPRISGSDGMKKQQTLLRKHFEEHGAKVQLQRFTAKQMSKKTPVDMANFIARWYPERTRRVILSAHYDTRPKADQEIDPRKHEEPFLSANDGGTGVALLMELAHHVKELKTNVGIDFVFFDGEEYVFEKGDEMFFGSKDFADRYRKARKPPHYISALNLDMVGGKTIKFPIEVNSWLLASPLVTEVWSIAEELECKAFRKVYGPSIQDDHIPLNRAGIPAVDIIDFSYPHWHKLSDTPENCSGESLAEVARVLSVWLQRVR